MRSAADGMGIWADGNWEAFTRLPMASRFTPPLPSVAIHWGMKLDETSEPPNRVSGLRAARTLTNPGNPNHYIKNSVPGFFRVRLTP